MTDLVLVSRAADFAARSHAGQRRKGAAKEPYVNHLAEVAELLAVATDGSDAALVAAGWLHDTIEDCGTTRDELTDQFSADVASLVAECTDDKTLAKAERKLLQIAHAPDLTGRARMIKIADKISNLRSLIFSPPDDWERARLIDYLDWSDKVVAGCRGVSPSLERIYDETASSGRAVL
ncbi:MAG: bifunctional (p)ppGpp synthetase/guanosine-3',5'-bis(diphosphate) 3'-pyrophosphohydrolase [Rhodopseudomonas palustris]|uniref:Bifunctional (P)ppGpp synthetase/guanosine-3',5'-bis(Diphosphate) 3'-pyrophosphohydrolase n=1 Tax=Rhodopseudomonas palustris TaxID=1076 RepID=A0A933RYT5_RHOPL|nr:bifunctional (p)ppGpp synthetase/guanosine-3',5'-bis(diphosphate) 3'-pyrophosphohydrolase [Rhodopseudomonas palustris]